MNYSREILTVGTPSFLVGGPWAILLETDTNFDNTIQLAMLSAGPLLRGFPTSDGFIVDFNAKALHQDLEEVVGSYGFDVLCTERQQEAQRDVVDFLDNIQAGKCSLCDSTGDHYNAFVSIYTITEYNKVRLNGLTYFATALSCAEFLQVLNSHPSRAKISVKVESAQGASYVPVSSLMSQNADLNALYKGLEILPNKMGAFINLQIQK